MSDDPAPPGSTGAMPEPGTMKVCWFCHMVVTLHQVPDEWYHWVADRDPVDGRWHCDGGVPGTKHNPALRTLHIPAPLLDENTGAELERWPARYTPGGEGRGPLEAPRRRTA